MTTAAVASIEMALRRKNNLHMLLISYLLMLFFSFLAVYKIWAGRAWSLRYQYFDRQGHLYYSDGTGEYKRVLLEEYKSRPLGEAFSGSPLEQAMLEGINLKPTFVQPLDSLTASTLPLENDKIVVVGKLASEDTRWIHDELEGWQSAIYIVDDTSARLHTAVGKGLQALPYLTYIVENYVNLPSTIAFVHAHKDGFPEAWHNDNKHYSNVVSLMSLRVDFVQRSGYVNLRCNTAIGCPADITPNTTSIDVDRPLDGRMPAIWRDLRLDGPLPSVIATPCCAQFAVSREQVHKRPLADYERYLRWLMKMDLSDEISGRAMEYLWHVIFGKEPVYCPDAQSCYCDVYGWCNDEDFEVGENRPN